VAIKDRMSDEFILATEETPVGQVVERVKGNPAAEYLVVRLQQGCAVIEIGEEPNQLQSELDRLADRIGSAILGMALDDVLELGWWKAASMGADEAQPVAEDYAVVLEGEQVVGVAGLKVADSVEEAEESRISPAPGPSAPTSSFSPPAVFSAGRMPSSLFGERYIFGREGQEGGEDARICPHCGQSFAYYKVKAAKGKVIYSCPKCGAEEPNP
jgi:hypothetical protein